MNPSISAVFSPHRALYQRFRRTAQSSAAHIRRCPIPVGDGGRRGAERLPPSNATLLASLMMRGRKTPLTSDDHVMTVRR